MNWNLLCAIGDLQNITGFMRSVKFGYCYEWLILEEKLVRPRMYRLHWNLQFCSQRFAINSVKR